MAKLSRRGVLGAGLLGAASWSAASLADETPDDPKEPKLWPLEGVLKVHPKFIYRFYLEYNGHESCALYGTAHEREPALLTEVKLPARVRVRGTFGTEYHDGKAGKFPSPFPSTWVLYMDVHDVEILK